MVKYDILQNGAYITSVTNTLYTAKNLNASSEYTLTIISSDAAGNESQGIPITIFTTEDTIPPEEVTDLIASNTTSETISFT